MLSDLILKHKRNTISNRVLDADIQKIETTVATRGKIRGSLDVSIIITYWNVPNLACLLITTIMKLELHNIITARERELYHLLAMDIIMNLLLLLNTG
jgi:hypothetical protein